MQANQNYCCTKVDENSLIFVQHLFCIKEPSRAKQQMQGIATLNVCPILNFEDMYKNTENFKPFLVFIFSIVQLVLSLSNIFICTTMWAVPFLYPHVSVFTMQWSELNQVVQVEVKV